MFLYKVRQEAYNRKYLTNIEDISEGKLLGTINKCLFNEIIEKLNLNEKNKFKK